MECPIFVSTEVLDKAGVLPENDEESGSGATEEERLTVFRDFVNSLDLPDLPDDPGRAETEGGSSN